MKITFPKGSVELPNVLVGLICVVVGSLVFYFKYEGKVERKSWSKPDNWEWVEPSLSRSFFLNNVRKLVPGTELLRVESGTQGIDPDILLLETHVSSEIKGVYHNFFFSENKGLFSVSWYDNVGECKVNENLPVPSGKENKINDWDTVYEISILFTWESVGDLLYQIETEREIQLTQPKWERRSSSYFTRKNWVLHGGLGNERGRWRIRTISNSGEISKWSDWRIFEKVLKTSP
ncbi:MAG: hypothetical protein LBS59_04565 [Puniceicoccales bacterium]|jgi:hypothetical protein|nr:hypothetical protein [Puniceicoccales bacterium]